MPNIPEYYSSLPPFLELFQSGFPILTYHKIGNRPRGTRLKGLYVKPSLFKKQLEELRRERFSSADLLTATRIQQSNRERAIAITFDDGYANVLENALEAMRDTGFRAIQFLVPDRLGQCNEWDSASGEVREPLMNIAQVKEWLAAGHEIGSHTLTHPFLTKVPLANAREEIVASKKKLEDLFAHEIKHFCYPYGDWNSAVRDLVQECGYTSACTTEAGVNEPRISPFQLKRFTARYRSRSWKNFRDDAARLFRKLVVISI